ncbi:bifunctional 2-polyprenyl-6-hydroxyphenol methylase/3-demethylubiquinol 3-O-methyltransferase UbiG [Marinoscillum sp. MHG1-6]|uniref:class I SAM-dependent methyltransferase n=1 Tax=Marinoscillum sp. MHG1-6 TaxID=2959627 RepID=UPI002158282A|nr:class I SAM-dependent methyltransferase [Marinoscillum sp. MHG1-6]
MNKREWFGEWFNSPYYHVLYNERDEREAHQFIDNLIKKLKPKEDAHFLDVACGRGRHAIYLNSKGFDVTGIDLSEQNLVTARESGNERLHFYQHDMREVFREHYFDFAVNLFTSFGYFDSREEDIKAIKAITRGLKPGGYFLIDFLNPYVVINDLVEAETKIIDGIKFNISRKFDGEFILKDIVLNNRGDIQYFQEKVRAIRRVDFLDYFQEAGLKVKEIFGNYNLKKYKSEKSERLIFLTQL